MKCIIVIEDSDTVAGDVSFTATHIAKAGEKKLNTPAVKIAALLETFLHDPDQVKKMIKLAAKEAETCWH